MGLLSLRRKRSCRSQTPSTKHTHESCTGLTARCYFDPTAPQHKVIDAGADALTRLDLRSQAFLAEFVVEHGHLVRYTPSSSFKILCPSSIIILW